MKDKVITWPFPTLENPRKPIDGFEQKDTPTWYKTEVAREVATQVEFSKLEDALL